MELRVPHMLHLFNIFHENKHFDNCAKMLEEEWIRMFGTKSLYDEHDCNVVSMNSLNTHDANDMQSHKLGEAMFDEDDIFCPPNFWWANLLWWKHASYLWWLLWWHVCFKE